MGRKGDKEENGDKGEVISATARIWTGDKEVKEQ